MIVGLVYWQTTLIKVVGVIVAVLLPAGNSTATVPPSTRSRD